MARAFLVALFFTSLLLAGDAPEVEGHSGGSAGIHPLTYYRGKENVLFSSRDVAAADLQSLPGDDQLRRVAICGCRIEEGCLTLVGRCGMLTHLNLGHTKPVSDADLEAIGQLRNLRSLCLGCTGVSDAGLAKLVPLAKLEWLDLHDTKMTDAGMESVAKLPSLKRLTLHRTSVTGRGLKYLEGLVHLRELTVTWVDPASVESLRKALPALEVEVIPVF